MNGGWEMMDDVSGREGDTVDELPQSGKNLETNTHTAEEIAEGVKVDENADADASDEATMQPESPGYNDESNEALVDPPQTIATAEGAADGVDNLNTLISCEESTAEVYEAGNAADALTSHDGDAEKQDGVLGQDYNSAHIITTAADIDIESQHSETTSTTLHANIERSSSPAPPAVLRDDDMALLGDEESQHVVGQANAEPFASLTLESVNELNINDVTHANGSSSSNRDADSQEDSISDIEKAINLLSESCEKASSDSSVHNSEGEQQEVGDVYSCSSTIMAHGGVTVYSGSVKNVPLNETMKSSSSSSDEENASPVVGLGGTARFAPATTASRKTRGRSRKPLHNRRKSSSSSTAESSINNRRYFIAAGVVSVALVVLVGLGLGLSNRGNNSETAAESNNAEQSAISVAGLGGAGSPIREEESSRDDSDNDDGSGGGTTSNNVLTALVPNNTNKPTVNPSMTSSYPPSIALSSRPSLSPSLKASDVPSSNPTSKPTNFPTTQAPTTAKPSSPPPTLSPSVDFQVGDLTITHTELGIRLSSGLSVKLIARTGQKTKFVNGQESNGVWHGMMDGAGIVPLPEEDGGGYVYVSNSEIKNGDGGVYGLYFDNEGNVIDYKTLLSGTKRNCGGGLSPWHTWISCEEVSGGQCWQVDPNKSSPNHGTPMETLLGGAEGGKYETVACDNRNPNRPVFFVTEDQEFGALRKFEANGNGWDSLHRAGRTTFLRILNNSTFEFTSNLDLARLSAATYYRNAEGIIYHEGLLYFTAKKTHTLFILDLQTMTYQSEYTGALFDGQGGFNAQPDQIFLGNYKRWIYFTEDGGTTPGVYVRDTSGKYHTIFEAIEGGIYSGDEDNSADETVGIALSPDRRKLYAGFQDAGVLFELTRDDGYPFE